MEQKVFPVLEFPHVGLDDTTTYRGYITRFFKDSEGNAFQIVINQNTGRVVNIWADAANESMSFTVRDSVGQPTKLMWNSQSAEVSSAGKIRYVQYTLFSKTLLLELGHFILGSMRIERDFQYLKRHTFTFESKPFIVEELTQTTRNIEQLPENVRHRHLAVLNAKNIEELRLRLVPQIILTQNDGKSVVLVKQPTFDGKNHLSLELSVDSEKAIVNVLRNKISIHSLHGQPIQLAIKVVTDSPSLTPLLREDICNREFLTFYEQAKVEHDSLLLKSSLSQHEGNEKKRLLRFQWLERQVKSVELLSYEEKLMAGLPNFATYFGRDMMMSALMLEPICNPSILEHVITSVLRKLSPSGEVSHEEGLGGQAIRENAAQYNKLMAEYFQRKNQNENDRAKIALAEAEKLLENLQAVTENYRMVDDDFQLPVLVARYLTKSHIQANRKRAFLLATSASGEETSRLSVLMRNLLYIVKLTSAYVEYPDAVNLVSFQKLDAHRWSPGSWRDSGAGYAHGRFAMDVNVIWVPKALESIEKIFDTLGEIGFSVAELESIATEIRGTMLVEYARHPEILQHAIKTWQSAVSHFEVHLSPQEVQRRVRAKLDWLPEEERAYWENILEKSAADKEGIEFLVLSLDEEGRPVPVVNTDPATLLFLEDFINNILKGEVDPEDISKRLRIFSVPYPVGLFVEGLGPLVANDAYTSPEVWEKYQRDPYHSPRVVWGREVNLLLLGLAKQILDAYDSEGRIKNSTLGSYVNELYTTLVKILTAVESSGLKHNELWSYQIVDGKLLPARYPTSSDIQLWNLTDLAVQFLLDRISKL